MYYGGICSAGDPFADLTAVIRSSRIDRKEVPHGKSFIMAIRVVCSLPQHFSKPGDLGHKDSPADPELHIKQIKVQELSYFQGHAHCIHSPVFTITTSRCVHCFTLSTALLYKKETRKELSRSRYPKSEESDNVRPCSQYVIDRMHLHWYARVFLESPAAAIVS